MYLRPCPFPPSQNALFMNCRALSPETQSWGKTKTEKHSHIFLLNIWTSLHYRLFVEHHRVWFGECKQGCQFMLSSVNTGKTQPPTLLEAIFSAATILRAFTPNLGWWVVGGWVVGAADRRCRKSAERQQLTTACAAKRAFSPSWNTKVHPTTTTREGRGWTLRCNQPRNGNFRRIINVYLWRERANWERESLHKLMHFRTPPLRIHHCGWVEMERCTSIIVLVILLAVRRFH